MPGSLLSGVSGLQVHQKLLDVVGNNLANLNTPGYKAARATFSDILSQTRRVGNKPVGNLGGLDPVQVGLGVKLASIELDTRQGALQNTGRTFDLALQGDGFFVVNNGREDLYTRVGRFALDAASNLVDTTTGFKVQNTKGQPINLDLNATMPSKATSIVGLTGNLDAMANAPAAETLASATAFVEGSSAAVLGSIPGPFALSDGMQMRVGVDGGAKQTVSFLTADFASIGAATATEVAAAIDRQLTSATASVDGGAIRVSAVSTGEQSVIDIDDAGGSPAALLGLGTTLVTGTEKPATLTTALNQLVTNTIPYQAGDTISVSGIDSDNKPVQDSFVYGTGPGQDGTTLSDFVSFLDTLYPTSKPVLRPDGVLELKALNTGEASMLVNVTDAPLNAGRSAWGNTALVVETDGAAGDKVSTSIDVFDSQGRRHTVDMSFLKTGDNAWQLTASLPEGGGQFADSTGSPLDAVVQQIEFNSDGSFARVSGVGVPNGEVPIQFDGLGRTQSVKLDFGDVSGFNGLTQFGNTATAAATEQDGFQAGTLSEVSVNPDGTIDGTFTNGQIKAFDQLEIATFNNQEGLLKAGDNLYTRGPNSGIALNGIALVGRAGQVLSGIIEGSNVDTAKEFVKLIIAQRGFQVNARTITTTDQVLQELANLIR